MPVNKDNLRIAQNTVIVYIRLIVTAIVGLITSRFVLEILGASDYGLYSVIGGVILMFTFISASLQSTTTRFINYEMGKKSGNISHVFNTARQIHVLFAIAIFIIAEILGIFYIQNYLNMDSGKIEDALFVFHVSIVAACLGVINVPYQGLLVAHERFFHVACVDIVTVLLKLLMVIILFWNNCSSVLRSYALGMSLLTVFSFFLYHYLCWKYWPSIVKYKIIKSVAQHKEMLVFNNYTLISTASLMIRNHGSNLLINFFWGTIVNAAYAISNTVHMYVNTFAGCFDQASAPQITQSLSKGDNERAVYIVNHTCRVCVLLVEIVFFILISDLDYVLYLWLGDNVPVGTTDFCYLTLLLAVVSATSGGLTQYIIGLGKLRKFSITTALLYLFALIFGVFFFGSGMAPYSIIILFLLADSINRGFQLTFLKQLVDFPVVVFLKEAYLRPAIVFLLGCMTVITYRQVAITTLGGHIIGMLTVAILLSSFVFYLGLYRAERKKILAGIITKIKHEK